MKRPLLTASLCAFVISCGKTPTPVVEPLAPIVQEQPTPSPQNPSSLPVTDTFFRCLAAPQTPYTAQDKERQSANVRRALNSRTAIIVDKEQHRLTLYTHGKPVLSYKVALGKDPVNQKLVEGDCRTPEGWFTVERKRSDKTRHKTDNYRTLILDYPTFADYVRMNRLKLQDHVLPLSAKPGSNISIHGMGDRVGFGLDLTDGCVELRNHDIHALYNRTPVGTPVVIVRKWPR